VLEWKEDSANQRGHFAEKLGFDNETKAEMKATNRLATFFAYQASSYLVDAELHAKFELRNAIYGLDRLATGLSSFQDWSPLT
jgi:hypothetical protein